MVDSSGQLFRLNSQESKVEPTLENKVLMPSTECEASTLVKNEQLVKEEIEIIDIDCDETNIQQGMVNESLTFQKQKSITLRDIRIREKFKHIFRHSQFVNTTQGISNLSVETASLNNNKVLINGKNFESYLNACKQFVNYSCNKCSFITWNETLLTQHLESVHVRKACPKCKLICENEKGFLLHYDQFCKSKNDVYECKRCKYQCKRMSLLNLHFKLKHSAPKVVKYDSNNSPHKETVNLTDHNNSQNVTPNNMPKTIIFVTAKSLYSKGDNYFAKQDDTANSVMALTDQRTKGYYYCLKCDFKSPSKFSVRLHCQEYHPYISDPLGSINDLEYIKYRALESNKQETSNSIIKCRICNMQFQHPVDLNSHVAHCQGTQHFSKRIEQNVPKQNSVLKPCICEQCGRQFTYSGYLEKHLRFCIRSFFCNDCPFKTQSKTALRNHIRLIHLNVGSVNENCLSESFRCQSKRMRQQLQCYCLNCCKRYTVELCAKRCPNCSKLLHFRCQICGNTYKLNDVQACEHVKNYLTKLDIQRYNSSNTGKYQCSGCSFEVVFTRLWYLKKHILKFHAKNRDHPCTKCNWDFKSGKSGLRKHLAYCGRKLSMECRVILTKIKAEPVESPISIKETMDFKENEMPCKM